MRKKRPSAARRRVGAAASLAATWRCRGEAASQANEMLAKRRRRAREKRHSSSDWFIIGTVCVACCTSHGVGGIYGGVRGGLTTYTYLIYNKSRSI